MCDYVQVVLHRLSQWQKVWTLSSPCEGTVVSALAWRPDGKGETFNMHTSLYIYCTLYICHPVTCFWLFVDVMRLQLCVNDNVAESIQPTDMKLGIYDCDWGICFNSNFLLKNGRTFAVNKKNGHFRLSDCYCDVN